VSGYCTGCNGSVAGGGGTALIRCQDAIDELNLEGDELVGARIVQRALEAPLRQLALNAGEEGATVVQTVKAKKGNIGYNAETGEYEDLMKAGIIDPTKVTRTALQNAASIAGLLLTTEVLIADLPEPKEKSPSTPGGGMDDMY